jgi:hypothetical protein
MNKYPSVKPAVWGAVAGAVAISVIGFSQFGWTLGSAEADGGRASSNGGVTVLTPICVEKFRQQAEAAAKVASSPRPPRGTSAQIIEKGGWATISEATPNSARRLACAEKLASRSDRVAPR